MPILFSPLSLSLSACYNSQHHSLSSALAIFHLSCYCLLKREITLSCTSKRVYILAQNFSELANKLVTDKLANKRIQFQSQTASDELVPSLSLPLSSNTGCNSLEILHPYSNHNDNSSSHSLTRHLSLYLSTSIRKLPSLHWTKLVT